MHLLKGDVVFCMSQFVLLSVEADCEQTSNNFENIMQFN